MAAEAAARWDGAASQAELMAKDQCILVDEADAVVGAASKRDAHRFDPAQPRGRLHRAFSVFLFDSRDRLLLQQRAASKITFPRVWTNTCCSHPLHGQQPDEVDAPADVASGAVPGARRAALRKLAQELGIVGGLAAADFKFLTRLHYCAADAHAAGPPEGEGAGARTPPGAWGEHEVDYILLARADVALAPNPDEVMATRHVTRAQLAQMMAPGSGLAWSPWFRIIAERFLDGWWADLDAALGTAKHEDYGTVHRVLG